MLHLGRPSTVDTRPTRLATHPAPRRPSTTGASSPTAGRARGPDFVGTVPPPKNSEGATTSLASSTPDHARDIGIPRVAQQGGLAQAGVRHRMLAASRVRLTRIRPSGTTWGDRPCLWADRVAHKHRPGSTRRPVCDGASAGVNATRPGSNSLAKTSTSPRRRPRHPSQHRHASRHPGRHRLGRLRSYPSPQGTLNSSPSNRSLYQFSYSKVDELRPLQGVLWTRQRQSSARVDYRNHVIRGPSFATIHIPP